MKHDPDSLSGITIDPEFRDLCPPITEEEERLLTESLDRDGLLSPFLIWKHEGKNILVDGHNRYRLIQKHGYDKKEEYPLQVEFREVPFNSRKVALGFIIANQLARRNLTPAQRAELVEKKEAIRKGEAKERQASGKSEDGGAGGRGRKKNLPPQKGEGFENTSSDKHSGESITALAAEANMSPETLRKYRKIKEWGCDDVTLDRLKKGELKIGAVYREMKDAREPEKAPEETLEEMLEKRWKSFLRNIPLEQHKRVRAWIEERAKDL